jgi:RNA polymerase sigma-70 factor, ECF subfamily
MDRARDQSDEQAPSTQITGRELTLEELFATEHVALFRALYLITGNTQEAEELMQDAFLKVWERWDSVSEMDNPAGYLCRVAVNGARSRVRRLRLSARHALAPGLPEDPFAAADLRDELVRALATLTERQRMALVLTDLMGIPADESAKLLGIRPPTVRSLASQARSALKVTMEDPDA